MSNPGPVIEAARKALTPRAREVLRKMVDNYETDEGELTQEGRVVYIGSLERTSPAIVMQLLRACVIRAEIGDGTGYTVYAANGDARGVLDG